PTESAEVLKGLARAAQVDAADLCRFTRRATRQIAPVAHRVLDQVTRPKNLAQAFQFASAQPIQGADTVDNKLGAARVDRPVDLLELTLAKIEQGAPRNGENLDGDFEQSLRSAPGLLKVDQPLVDPDQRGQGLNSTHFGKGKGAQDKRGSLVGFRSPGRS